MITARVIRNGGSYLSAHLLYPDYLDEQATIQGEWFGKSAERLEIADEVVDRQQFENLRESKHPLTAELLRARAELYGSKSRNFYDFTISAPKSVSVMALVAEDERLVSAHHEAVRATLAELESFAGARVRSGGRNEDRVTGNLVMGLFQHDTSRALDPQLHSHCVAANLTFDAAEGRWKALQARAIYDNLDYLTEFYRSTLAAEVRKCGYEVENVFDRTGKSLGFEIVGIGKDVLEKFSQRSADRDRAISEFEREENRAPTKREIAVLVRESRPDKLQKISAEEVRAAQRARLTTEELRSLSRTKQTAKERGPLQKSISVKAAVDHAVEHIFERVSVTTRKSIQKEALRFSKGHVAPWEVLMELEGRLSSGEFLTKDALISTREALEREVELVRSVNDGIGKFDRLGTPEPFSTTRMSADQLSAVIGILDSRDRVVSLHGAAGTGKTDVLQALQEGIKADGRASFAVAPTASAVAALRERGFEDAVTVEKFLQVPGIQDQARGRVVFVDEAGMIGTSKFATLLNVTEKLDSRVVLIGDTNQLRSVDAGDALRILHKDSELTTHNLYQVFRQDGVYREAMKALRNDPTQGFKHLERMKAVHQVDEENLTGKAAEEFVRLARQPNVHEKTRSVIAVCHTWKEIGALSSAIRGRLAASGRLGKTAEFTRLQPLSWTEAQKKDLTNYKIGMALVFHRATKDAKKDEIHIVKGVVDGKVVTSAREGQHFGRFTGKQAGAFSVFTCEQIQVAVGDKLLFQANRAAKVASELLATKKAEAPKVSRAKAPARQASGRRANIKAKGAKGRRSSAIARELNNRAFRGLPHFQYQRTGKGRFRIVGMKEKRMLERVATKQSRALINFALRGLSPFQPERMRRANINRYKAKKRAQRVATRSSRALINFTLRGLSPFQTRGGRKPFTVSRLHPKQTMQRAATKYSRALINFTLRGLSPFRDKPMTSLMVRPNMVRNMFQRAATRSGRAVINATLRSWSPYQPSQSELDKAFKATNGEIVTVAGINERNQLVLTDGRTVATDYQQFTYGYAVTVNGAQGKTVDSVIVVGSQMSREHFYVAASRGRETVSVFTPNKAELLASIQKSGERMSASEVKALQQEKVSERPQSQSVNAGQAQGKGHR